MAVRRAARPLRFGSARPARSGCRGSTRLGRPTAPLVEALRASAIVAASRARSFARAGPCSARLAAPVRHACEPQAGGWWGLSRRWASRSRSPQARSTRGASRPSTRPGRDQRSSSRRAIFAVELSRRLLAGRALPGGAVRSGSAHRGAARGGIADDIRVLVQTASEVAGVTGKVDVRAVELLDLTPSRPAMGRQVTF